MSSRRVIVLLAVGLAVCATAVSGATTRAKVTRVRVTVTLTNASGVRAPKWTLTVKVPKAAKLSSATGAKAKLERGVLTLSPPRARSLAAGAKATITIVISGAKAPSSWKAGSTACAAKSAGRRGHTALVKVRCTLPKAKGKVGVGPGAGPGPGAPAPTTPTMPATPSPAPATPGDWFTFSPYADLSLPATPDLNTVKSASGVGHFTLGFVVSSTSDACTPAWGGYPSYPASGASAYEKAQFATLRQSGGDVVASFGGQAGSELAVGCTDLTALTNAYQSVIDAYGLTHIDFDVEGAATADTTADDLRAKAIVKLQQHAAAAGTNLRVGFTLSTGPTGMDDASAAVLSDAVDNGVDVSLVNVMAMDYGSSSDPLEMGDAAISAGTALIARLTALYPGLSAAQVRRRAGVTAMLGVNDDSAETFSVADAQKLATWAGQQHIGMLGMWSIARDHQCPAPKATADATCSSIGQSPWDFAKALNAFTG